VAQRLGILARAEGIPTPPRAVPSTQPVYHYAVPHGSPCEPRATSRIACRPVSTPRTTVSENAFPGALLPFSSMRRSVDRARFDRYVERLAAVLGHADRRAPLVAYLTGLLLPGERKSVEPMAARVAPREVSRTHQCPCIVSLRARPGRSASCLPWRETMPLPRSSDMRQWGHGLWMIRPSRKRAITRLASPGSTAASSARKPIARWLYACRS
jgi:hypothetical protein